jgi:hypothetical protein
MAPRKALDDRSASDFTKILGVAAFYTTLTGILNGIAVSELGTPVGYTSGPCVNAGRFLANGDMTAWWKILGISANFYAGGLICGVTGSNYDDIFEGRRSFMMLVSAALLALGTFSKKNLNRPILAIQIWALSQGIMNAITSKFSAAPIRATHTAGGMTDSAISIGQAFVALSKGTAPPRMRKAILNMVCNIGMIIGGIASVKNYKRFGVSGGYHCAAALAASHFIFPMILPPAEEEEEKKKSA